MSELNPNDLDAVGAIASDEKGQPSKVEGKHGHAVDSGGEGGRRPMSKCHEASRHCEKAWELGQWKCSSNRWDR